jgi:hypothetical protein
MEPLMDEEGNAADNDEPGEFVPYAHRDIKPGILHRFLIRYV